MESVYLKVKNQKSNLRYGQDRVTDSSSAGQNRSFMLRGVVFAVSNV